MNMYTMLCGENHVSDEELAYVKWDNELCRILRSQPDEDFALALFLDGATPKEAAEEIQAASYSVVAAN